MIPERIKHGLIDYSDVAVSEDGDVLPGDDVFHDPEIPEQDREVDVDNPEIEPDALGAIQALAIEIENDMNSKHPPSRWTLSGKIGRRVALLVKIREEKGLSTRGMIPIVGRDRKPGVRGFTPGAPDKMPAEQDDSELDLLTDRLAESGQISHYHARLKAAAQLGIRLDS